VETPWTDKARRAVALAFRAARQRAEGELTVTSLLIGLLELPHSVAKDCLKRLHVQADALAQALGRARPVPDGPAAAAELSPPAQSVLVHAERLARRLGREAVGTDVLLAAILERPDRDAGEAFRACSIEPSELGLALGPLLRPRRPHPPDRGPSRSASFEEAIERWTPAELLAQVLAYYERKKQAAIRREDYAAAELYRDRARQLRELGGEGKQ